MNELRQVLLQGLTIQANMSENPRMVATQQELCISAHGSGETLEETWILDAAIETQQ
jgi:hypothetical protein